MRKSKAQTALEYILLVGGAMAVLIAVFFIARGNVLGKSSLQVENTTVTINQTFASIQPRAPVISNLLVVTGTLVANVTWKTDIPSSSTVKFGTVAPPASSVGSTALVTDHKVQLSLPAHQFNFVCVAISCTQGGGCSSAVCDFSLGLPIE